jgi:hypothetical protein
VTLAGTGNAGQQVSRTTTTDSQGAYRFANLPGGTYTIAEQQPLAMIDGAESRGTVNGSAAGTVGSDRFTNIVLPAAGSGVNFNFGESSLQPQFINARLFTVSSLTRNAMIRDIVLQAERSAAAALVSSAPVNPPAPAALPGPPSESLIPNDGEAEGEEAPTSSLSLSAALHAAQKQIQACGGAAGPVPARPIDAASPPPTQPLQSPPATPVLCDSHVQQSVEQIFADEEWLRWLADPTDPLD